MQTTSDCLAFASHYGHAGLRKRLIDMNELTMNARANSTEIPGGLKIEVTGTGRTVAAIQRMVPAHAPMINGHNGWQVTVTLLPNSALLSATASDPKEVAHIRGLGFIGPMATGAHYQARHLAIAEGKQPMHNTEPAGNGIAAPRSGDWRSHATRCDSHTNPVQQRSIRCQVNWLRTP